MKFLEFLRLNRRTETASTAKQRLQVIIAHEKAAGSTGGFEFLPLMQRELLEVIKKYIEIDPTKVKVDIERGQEMSVLEVNIELPSKLPRHQLV
jgi:cell division topological specificity factor